MYLFLRAVNFLKMVNLIGLTFNTVLAVNG